ncbi:uncharacterized protein LOC114474024 isoform X2 [Gouania willdenowi]|uniref:uncharacterized protein LOC114474024 isoform X2 n=1 Tax=Gouania willdenowi TaxID=441366 RepID=UPI001056B919|nr:uncharacterized protein LOC114474024 isoform X2 [Gouania willdenowi]
MNILAPRWKTAHEMPRLKSYKRSQATKRRFAALQQSSDDSASLGRGSRCSGLPEPTSVLTGKPCKLVIPDVSPTQKVVVTLATAAFPQQAPVVGDSPGANGTCDVHNSSHDAMNPPLTFNPICNDAAKLLCKNLGIAFQKTEHPTSTDIGLLGPPCSNYKNDADANSFFRALCHTLSGTQNKHRRIRLAVVKHLKENAEIYENILRQEYSSVDQYVKSSKMNNVGILATEVEIQAAADHFGVHVYIYSNNGWLVYKCNNNHVSQGVYLEMCHGRHYESVVCTQSPNLDGCCHYCEAAESSSAGYSLRRLQTTADDDDDINFDEETCDMEKQLSNESPNLQSDGSTSYNFRDRSQVKSKQQQSNTNQGSPSILKHLRQRRAAHFRNLYRTNESFRQKVKERHRKKYRDDEAYRTKLKEKSKLRYCKQKENAQVLNMYRTNESYRQKVKERQRKKYRDDEDFRTKQKEKSKLRYWTQKCEKNLEELQI